MFANNFRVSLPKTFLVPVMALAVVLLPGCASIPTQIRLDNTAVGREGAAIGAPELHRNILVQMQGSRPSHLEAALIRSLQIGGYAASGQKRPEYVLSAIIRGEERPTFGLDMRGSLQVTYSLRDQSTREVFKETIRSSSSATLSDELNGQARAILVMERYIRENVYLLMNRLPGISQGIASTRESQKKRARVQEQMEQARRDQELQRVTIANQQAIERFSVFDLFSERTFQSTYPSSAAEPYEIAPVVNGAFEAIVPRLKIATEAELRRFRTSYGTLLTTFNSARLLAIIQEREIEDKKALEDYMSTLKSRTQTVTKTKASIPKNGSAQPSPSEPVKRPVYPNPF